MYIWFISESPELAQIIKRLLPWFYAILVLSKHLQIEYNYWKMLRNSQLNENEKNNIYANKLEGKFISFLARKLSRSRRVVRNYLKHSESYGTRKRPRHAPKITNAARRWLFRKTSKISEFTYHSKKIRQLLSESPNLVNINKKTAQTLTAKHKKMCVDKAKKKVTWTREKWEMWGFLMRKSLICIGPTSPRVIGMI